MSLQILKGVGSSTKDVYSAETGAISASLYAVKCGLKVTVPVANQAGARRTQAVAWDSPGTSLQNAINNAADVAQFIVDNSDGYATTFTMQLGLYRPDVEGTPMEAGELSYASIEAVNTKTNAGVVQAVNRARSVRLYVPFCKSDVSKASLKAGVQALCTAGKLGSINFHNSDKDSFDVGTMSYVNGITIKDYEAKALQQLTSNDSDEGISDGVLRKG